MPGRFLVFIQQSHEACGGRGTGGEESEEECVKCHSWVAKEGSDDSPEGGVTTGRAGAEMLALLMPDACASPGTALMQWVPAWLTPHPARGQRDTGLSSSWAWGRAAPVSAGQTEAGAGHILLHPFFAEQGMLSLDITSTKRCVCGNGTLWLLHSAKDAFLDQRFTPTHTSKGRTE